MKTLIQVLGLVLTQASVGSSFGSVLRSDFLAHFSFDGNGIDRSGHSPQMDLRNVTFSENTLFLNGLYEFNDPPGFRAIARITGFSYTAFTVAVDFYRLESVPAGTGQGRNILTGGASYRWLSFQNADGHLALSLNNGQSTHVFPETLLAVQRWHRLVCAVDLNNRQIRTFLDGAKLEAIHLPSDFRFNVQGTPAEEPDKVFTFSNYSNGDVFYGYADNLVVLGRPLSEAEVGGLCFAEPVGWLAHFPFSGNGDDRTGHSPPMDLRNAAFPDNTLFLNGLYEFNDPAGFSAIARITGFSYTAFTVAVDFYPLSSLPAATIRRRNILTGGTSYRWLSFQNEDGHLTLSLNNGQSTHIFLETLLAPQRWHRLVCAVDLKNRQIRTFLDGVKLEEIHLAPDFLFDVQGTPAEEPDKVFTFSNYSNGAVFYGYADNLVVIGQALRDPDIPGCLSYPKPIRCFITDIDAFLEQCPTIDPAVAEILGDFKIKKDGVEVTDFSCAEPISTLPIDQYTDELILLQALRTIYYLDKDRGHLPWTELSLYDWLKSKVGGFNISSTATFNSCCGVWPDGTRFITLVTGDAFNRNFDRTWLGMAGNIALLMHEARHVDGFPHSGCCPLGGSACDLRYDENNLSPYGIQYWLEKSWVDGTLHTGFACSSPARLREIKDWLRSSANGRLDRFCETPPPLLTDANNPVPPCDNCCAPHQPVRSIRIRRLDGGRSEITFSGTLEFADAIEGPYAPVPQAGSPFAVEPASGQRFYRTVGSCEGNPCLVTLPAPHLEFAGTEDFEANGRQWTRYLLRVMNRSDYPNELFAPAPQLPPCGLNPTAARTWVDVLSADGQILNGFCGLGSSAGLSNLWFALSRSEAPPHVRIELKDRLCGRTVGSGVLTIPGP